MIMDKKLITLEWERVPEFSETLHYLSVTYSQSVLLLVALDRRVDRVDKTAVVADLKRARLTGWAKSGGITSLRSFSFKLYNRLLVNGPLMAASLRCQKTLFALSSRRSCKSRNRRHRLRRNYLQPTDDLWLACRPLRSSRARFLWCRNLPPACPRCSAFWSSIFACWREGARSLPLLLGVQGRVRGRY